MDNQTLIETLESLKKRGFVYNDADFCRKTGMSKTFLSEMKAGKRTITQQTVTRIHDTFPDFFAPKTVDMTDPLGDLIALARYNMERGHDEIDRLIAIMEKREGVAKKEKTA